MDRMDGWKRPVLGRSLNTQLRDARFPEDAVIPPESEIQPGQSLASISASSMSRVLKRPQGPDPNHFGLWLDKRITSPDCQPDPFENETKYPGVKTGARGKTVPVGSFYGYATGIVGLRCSPTLPSMKKPRRNGIPSAITKIPPITFQGIWSSHTVSACPAASATSDRFRPTLRKIRSIPAGNTSARTWEPSIFGSIGSLRGKPMQAASPSSCSTPNRPARSIPH